MSDDAAARAQIELGRAELAGNRLRAADLRFDQAQRHCPTSPDGFYWAACTAAHAAQDRRAEYLFDATLDLDPGYGKAYLQRGYVRLRQRDADRAAADLLAAAENGVTSDNAGLLSAALTVSHGNAEQALVLTALPGDVPVPVEITLARAVAHAVSGRRTEAADQLARAARKAPSDHRISHAQAVLSLHTLGSTPDDHAGWRACIGAWVSVLHDEDFWATWRADAQRRYRTPVSTETIDAARSALDEFVEQRLPSDDLALLLRRERAAAALLAGYGGLPGVDPSGKPLVCGPLRIAELGVAHQLSTFLLGLAADHDVVGLFRQFSEIGLAVAQLAAGRPEAAARAALDLRCPSCARIGNRPPPAIITEPLLCEPDCARFDDRNPAFAACADSYDELARSSAALATRTLLGIARADITTTSMDLIDARRSWRGAVTLAQRFGQREEVLREVADEALGRARVLSRRADRTDAIAVLDAAMDAIPAKDQRERARVSTELAFQLSDRGIRLFNEDAANAQRARADLTRAVSLNPDQPRTRVDLGLVLQRMSYAAFREFDLPESIRLMSEAVEQFHIAVTKSENPDYQEALDQARRELARMLEEYTDQPPDAES